MQSFMLSSKCAQFFLLRTPTNTSSQPSRRNNSVAEGSMSRPSSRSNYCATTVWVKKSPPTVFWIFFPNGWNF